MSAWTLHLLKTVVGVVTTVLVSLLLHHLTSSPWSSDAVVASQVTLEPSVPTGPLFEDVGGHEQVKRTLWQSVVLPFRRPDLFFGPGVPLAIRPPRGVLLHGPPGTGKSMLARATAREAGGAFLAVYASAIESKWWGEAPKLLQEAFRLAKSSPRPCVLFFDEIDGSFGRARSSDDQSCVYSLKCELLRNFDELELEGAPVAVVACTNHLGSLDPALRRRFQRVLAVATPSRAERLAILRRLTRDESASGERAVRAVAGRRTDGYSGADLTALYEAASAARWRRGGVDVEACADRDELMRTLGPITLGDWSEAIAAGAATPAPAPALDDDRVRRAVDSLLARADAKG